MEEGGTTGARPLGRIALALSGGGYRAAAFHLGALKALDEVGLLDDVRLLSTASGGSITGAMWALSLSQGHTFARFEDEMRAVLARNLLAEALDRLHEGERPPSAIQRLAEVYDGVFGGRRLGELADDPVLRARIDHIIVNATHFSLGYGFRFTFPARGRAAFGNKRVHCMPDDAWRDVRLADAVAASSCFPAGFEPIHFPDDFAWTGAPPVVHASGVGSDEKENMVPLMDGGIYDNQAADALLLIHRSTKDTEDPGDDIGLLFCSDTDQKQMPYYEPTPRSRPKGLLGVLGSLPLGVAMALAVATALVLALCAWRGSGAGASLAVVGATLLGAGVIGLRVLLVAAQRRLPSYPRLTDMLLRTRIHDLARLAIDRFHSVLALTTSVFMYRVRALGYVVAQMKLPERVVESHIYDALGKAFAASKTVSDRAGRAREMDTTLWMDAEQRDDVVGTGYATALGALDRYLTRWAKTLEDGEPFRDGEPYPQDLARRVADAWKRAND